MGKIKFTDIIALAKSGWTPDAVKEIVSMDIKDETDEKPEKIITIPEVQLKQAFRGPDEYKEFISKLLVEAFNDPEKAIEKESDTTDYKKLYEEEHEKLSKLQDSNTKKEIEPEIEIDEVLQGITKKLI